MGDGTTAIIQRIARPDAAISIIEMVAVRVEVAFLPSQVTLQHRPHLLEICLIGIVLEVPQQLVDVVEVHIIMVHLVVTVRIAADIAIRVHLRMPAFL